MVRGLLRIALVIGGGLFVIYLTYIGETIPLGRERTLRVVGIVVSNEDEPSVLIVEDAS